MKGYDSKIKLLVVNPLGFHQAVSVGIYTKIPFIIYEMKGIGVSLCDTVFKTSSDVHLPDIAALHLTCHDLT